MANTGYFFSDTGLKHITGRGHPESPQRLEAIQAAFTQANISPTTIQIQPATIQDLLRVHTQEHIDTIQQTCAQNAHYHDADTRMMDASWAAALTAAGAAITACSAVLDGRLDNAFSAMRPPGHHAESDRAMGFCLFNNIAIAAQWLRQEKKLHRVAILDWDVHHGNGTQHTFYDDPTVLYISLHQYPHYPGTGHPSERGADNKNLNLILPPGAPAEDWMTTFHNQAIPALQNFNPDFLLISCGFDAHHQDPLSSQNLDHTHYKQMTQAVKDIANGKIVSLLEGGYNLQALARCAVDHYNELQG